MPDSSVIPDRLKALLRSDAKVVGLKQTILQIEDGLIAEVLLASDADEHIKQRVAIVCGKCKIPIVTAPSKVLMGRECGIDVGAAVVGIRKRQKIHRT